MSISESFASWRDLVLAAKLFGLTRRYPTLAKMFLDCSKADLEETRTDLNRLSEKLAALIAFDVEFEGYSKLLVSAGRQALDRSEAYPCLHDRTAQTGFDRHYVYHPAWAARVLAKSRPKKHVDISSTLHFAALISAFMEVEFYDYRPAPLHLPNLTSSSADLTNLPFASGSIKSLSCMHVLEHIGLGRYGDPYDIDGDKKAACELSRVLASDGRLLVAFPVGRPRIQFNAHRIYSHEQVLAMFSGLVLLEHALIPDGAAESGLILEPDAALISAQSYGCGCYVFSK